MPDHETCSGCGATCAHEDLGQIGPHTLLCRACLVEFREQVDPPLTKEQVDAIWDAMIAEQNYRLEQMANSPLAKLFEGRESAGTFEWPMKAAEEEA